MIKKIMVKVFISVSLLLLVIVLYGGYQAAVQRAWVEVKPDQSPELSSVQKEKDFRYLTGLIRKVYPFAEVNETEKGLDNIIALEDEYVKRAAETDSNKEFYVVFDEYLHRLGQTGHAYLKPPSDAVLLNSFAGRYLLGLRKDHINRADYWWDMMGAAREYVHSEIREEYNRASGTYELVEAFKLNDRILPVGTRITKIEGMDVDDFAKTQQNCCFSATEDFVVAVKSMGLAKLVGINTTGGSDPFMEPMLYALPESGIMFVLEVEKCENAEGQIDEIYGTKPDALLERTPYPRTYDRDTLLADSWIQWVRKD